MLKVVYLSSSFKQTFLIPPNTCINKICTISNQALWHFRLKHLSHYRLSKMSQVYPNITHDNKASCDICHFAKHKKLPFNYNISKASRYFELIHFDVWYPLAANSIIVHKYFLTVLDNFSRYVWIIILKSKTEVSTHDRHFVTLIENQFKTCLNFIRTDNGLEFLLSSFYASKGIIHQRYCVETPQQNGRF